MRYRRRTRSIRRRGRAGRARRAFGRRRSPVRRIGIRM